MKGLLLKDWYMIKKYCRAYLLNCGRLHCSITFQ